MNLSAADFKLDGPLGSQGTTIEMVGRNHFRAVLGHAPQHPEWCNKIQFQITRNAKGNALRLDVVFDGGDSMRLNEYSCSWSYDAKNWRPIHWENGTKEAGTADTLVFPEFAEDVVYLGHQVPMSYEDLVELVEQWRKSPYVAVHVLGRSLGGRDLYRIQITDPNSPHPPDARWVHHFANQHPGEHNSQWRMVGMIDWLLSGEADDFRRRNICHFIVMMSPDAPSNGWYRVNAQGVDMNRSYRAEGADPAAQAHEACICQKDLEDLMASDAPVTDVWSMHTWGGVVDPIITPGREIGAAVGPWEEFRDIIKANDPRNLVKPMHLRGEDKLGGVTWTGGPHAQFGITTVLCEGAGAIYTQEENLASGTVLIRSIGEYYKSTKQE
ncbi:MAG: M14 family zinc carboxypeptidase [Planctomycetota bacterium]